MSPLLRTVTLTRYVTPLREGGSLPAVMEADDDGLYAVKFRGAGQGPKALIAELLAGEIGRALGLAVPEIVLAQLDTTFGRNEPDQEIQDLLRASVGLNLALDYLPGALAYDPLAPPPVEARLASEIVWFDAYCTNVDRTARNTNMLLWHGRLWLIDHGAALYFHHAWRDYLAQSRTPFAAIKEHVLLPFAGELAAVDAALRPKLAPDVLEGIVAAIPEAWLEVGAAGAPFETVEAHRAAYLAYLTSRLDAAASFVEEAQRARAHRL